jgi:hypothetical protein|tara:strand:- start:3496 stop:3738 length:243 start_codon:yes stop_codon:yes gene_type:complete
MSNITNEMQDSNSWDMIDISAAEALGLDVTDYIDRVESFMKNKSKTLEKRMTLVITGLMSIDDAKKNQAVKCFNILCPAI